MKMLVDIVVKYAKQLFHFSFDADFVLCPLHYPPFPEQVYKLSPSMIENNGYLDRLHSMLYDVDATVVINAIYAIEELQLASGGLAVTQPLLMALLNRIGEFSEWGLNTILGLISKYRPANEDETYAIMNLLDPVLRTANSGAVLATFKCFTSLTARMPELQPQIYQRGNCVYIYLCVLCVCLCLR